MLIFLYEYQLFFMLQLAVYFIIYLLQVNASCLASFANCVHTRGFLLVHYLFDTRLVSIHIFCFYASKKAVAHVPLFMIH